MSEDLSLPSSRLEALKLQLKEHFSRFILLSLLSFLFALPFFAYFFFFSFFLKPQIPFSLPYVLSYLTLVPLFMILSLGQGGLFHCARRMAFLEGMELPEEFFLGVKRNAKEALFFGFFFSLNYVLLKFALLFLSTLSLSSIWVAALSGVLYAFFFLLEGPLLFLLAEASVYSNPLYNHYLNGVRFYLGGFLLNLPICLAYLFPLFLFEAFPYLPCFLGCVAFEAVFYFSFSSYYLTLRAFSLFDRSINKDDFPEIYRKGLRK